MPTSNFLQRRPWAAFLLTLALGIIILAYVIGAQHGKESYWTLGEHLASALIVAGIMGLTYDWFVHKRTIQAFIEILDNEKKTLDESLDGIMAEIHNIQESIQAVRADDVFSLIRDMVLNRDDHIPTLYKPARHKENEFVFATNHDFFFRLAANPKERKSIVETLRGWLQPTSPRNLRFIAGDFVGLLRLSELAAELEAMFEAKKNIWPAIKDPEEKGVLLNYLWAASRCERPMYRRMIAVLLNTSYVDVQEWILFVPRQMQDIELQQMIQLYLDTRGEALSENMLRLVIAAMKELHIHGMDMTEVAKQHRPKFAKHSLTAELDEAIGVAVDGVKPWWKIF